MMDRSYYTPQTSTVSPEATDALSAAASEFSKNVQEATGKLVAAAEQFGVMSSGLTNAVAEVKAASLKAEEARTAAEAVQARMDRDYSNLSSLMKDLQERIGALAVLARPFGTEAEVTPAPASEAPAAFEASSENSSEGSAEESATSTENDPSHAGWRGWQG